MACQILLKKLRKMLSYSEKLRKILSCSDVSLKVTINLKKREGGFVGFFLNTLLQATSKSRNLISFVSFVQNNILCAVIYEFQLILLIYVIINDI